MGFADDITLRIRHGGDLCTLDEALKLYTEGTSAKVNVPEVPSAQAKRVPSRFTSGGTKEVRADQWFDREDEKDR